MPQTIDLPYLDDSEVFGPSSAGTQTIALPFIDGGQVFAPLITSGDPPALAVTIGGVAVDDCARRRFREPRNEVGSFSFTIPRDLPPSVDFDDVVTFKVDGQARFAGVVDSLVHTALSQGEAADQVIEVSGPSIIAEFAKAVVHPSRGVEAEPIEEVRSFSWPSPDYSDSAWPFAKQVNRQRDYATWRSPVPWIWPDTTGFWIWANVPGVTSIYAPPGVCFFRKTFTLAADATVRVFCAFDLTGQLWIDGAEMTSFTSFTVGRYIELRLTAGDHVIAARVINENKPTLPNPGGFIAAVYTLGDAGLLDELIVHTDGTWRCLPYPTAAPGFTHGQVIDTLIDEAQAEDELDGWSVDFSANLDSSGQAWGAYREITVQVGRTLLDTLREMADGGFIEFEAAPGGRVLRAWASGNRGEVRSVTLQQTTDPATSDFLSLRHAGKRTRYNRTLIRYGGGWIEEEDTTSITANGGRGLYLALGAVRGESEARRMAGAVMERWKAPAFITAATLAPHNADATPGTAYWLGDTIDCPDETDTDTAMVVAAIGLEEDDVGLLTWPVELRDLVLEEEDRFDSWLRRMADGSALGGARVSSPIGTPPPTTQQVTALTVAEFSYDNSTLTASLSPRRPAAASGNMVEIVAEITTPGSTATVVRVLLNGATLGSNLTVPAGEEQAEIPLEIVPVRANVDKLQVEIITAGTGAEGLDVQVRAI
jgi:hypothetical protein